MLSSNKKTNALLLGMALVLVLIAYLPALQNGFVWDDNDVILANLLIKDIKNLPALFAAPDAVAFVEAYYYRPITYVTFMLDYQLWGGNAGGFHATNLLLHLINVALVFYLARSFGMSSAGAFAAAAVFGLVPFNSETVHFLSGGRNTLLCAAFTMGAFMAHMSGRRARAWALFALGALSKEFALMLPLLIIARQWATQGRPTLREMLTTIAPYGAIALAYMAARTWVLKGAAMPFNDEYLWAMQTLVIKTLFKYLCIFVFPFAPKVPIHIWPGVDGYFAAALAAFAAIVYGLWRYGNRIRGEVFYLFWIALFLLPVSGLLPMGYIQVADRYMYLSSVGYALLAARLLVLLNARVMALVLAGLLLSFAAVDLSVASAWRSDMTLSEKMIADAPESSLGYHNLATEYYYEGNLKKATEILQQSVELQPVVANNRFTLALMRYMQGDKKEAIRLMRAVGELVKLISPNLTEQATRSRFALVRFYRSAGMLDEAASLDKELKAKFPDIDRTMEVVYINAYNDAFKTYESGDLKGAVKKFVVALEINPDSFEGFYQLGVALAQQERFADASVAFERAVSIRPDSTDGRFNLALAYFLDGQILRARQQAQQYLSLGGQPRVEIDDILSAPAQSP